MSRPRIAIPVPHSQRQDYVERALPRYLRAVEQAGGEPVVVPILETPEEIARAITSCHGVLLPGSPADVDPQKYGAPRHEKTEAADPARDAADELLLQDAYNLRKPVFGICYGMQSLNVWRTGTLIQHIESAVHHQAGGKVPRAHAVAIEPASRLAEILSACQPASRFSIGNRQSTAPSAMLELQVNSSHHQAVGALGDGLRVAARCPQDGIIEAIEGAHAEHFVLGVEWHPERTLESERASSALFCALVQAAEDWRAPVSG